MTRPIREGFHTITPYLTTPELDGLLRFVTEGLGGVETFRDRAGEGGVHVEVRIGDSMLMIGKSVRSQHAMLYLYVADPDASYARALAAGASSLSGPADTPDGERRAGVADSYGNKWYFGRPR